jgi:hypothetical protein
VVRSTAFKKEPLFGRGKVIRGTLQLGGGVPDEIAFAWARGAGKLYLDLNGNLDLTDDPTGVYSSGRSPMAMSQTFPGVRLPMKAGGGSRQILADLQFYDYGSGPNCSAALRSFWQGKVTLQDQEWQVGLLGSPTGQGLSFEGSSLLLRPWAERNRPVSLNNGSLDAFPFSRKLFFGQQAYQLHCTNEVRGNSVQVRIGFKEKNPKLGELKIAGRFVQRVTLEGGPFMVVVDHPEGVVKVPAGSYGQAKVCLRKGEAEAYLEERGRSSSGRITVSENKPAVLTAGGPLTNSVSVSRRGKYLSLDYRLVGAGGPYQVANQDRSHPPEFTIYQGDQKVASGKFEFG